ncbi:hypothetical protein ACVWXO_008053 [Bradyrhizobium sp. LM2.7]
MNFDQFGAPALAGLATGNFRSLPTLGGYDRSRVARAIVRNCLEISRSVPGLLTGERRDSARFILNRIDRMMLRGERRRLLLSNAAIDAYRFRPMLVTLDA